MVSDGNASLGCVLFDIAIDGNFVGRERGVMYYAVLFLEDGSDAVDGETC